MTQIYPYLKFNGTCREAMTFYQQCLGGQLTLQTVGDSPVAAQLPAAFQSRIMHATLINEGLVLQASDVMNPDGLTESDTVSLSLNCTSEPEIRSIFAGLSAGGKINSPLKVEFWGALFGMLTDRYGKQWMLNYDNKKLVAEPGKPEIITMFDLDAPRSLVFETLTQPGLIPDWWGPAILTTVVEKMEVRPGGTWRFVQHDASGNEYGFHGVYHTVLAPEKLIYTFEYEGTPGHVLLETITLEEHEGKTRMVDKSSFQSVSDRDGMLSEGMEEYASEYRQRLSALLATILAERRK